MSEKKGRRRDSCREKHRGFQRCCRRRVRENTEQPKQRITTTRSSFGRWAADHRSNISETASGAYGSSVREKVKSGEFHRYLLLIAESVGSSFEYFSNCKIQIKNGTVSETQTCYCSLFSFPSRMVMLAFFCAGSAMRPTS